MTVNYNVGLGENHTENSYTFFDCFMFTNSVALKILMIVGYSVVMATSIVGNSILVFVYFKNKSMKNTVNCCIMNMVFADLLVTLVYMPRMVARIVGGLEWLVEGTSGLILCKFVSISQEVSIGVSILTVVIIAFERFFAVAFPLRVLIPKKLSMGLLCATWLVSMGARCPMFYAVKTVHSPSGKLGCFWVHTLSFPTKEARKYYHTFMLITSYGLPLLFIITLYTSILVFLKRRQGLIGNATRNRASATNRKVTQMILAVITVFLLCWLLYFIAIPLEEFWNVPLSCEVHFLRFFLGHMNSACNPIICLVFSENYRNGIKRSCFGRLRRWKRRQRHVSRGSTLRERSISTIALLSVKTLERDSSFQHRKGINDTSFQYEENGV